MRRTLLLITSMTFLALGNSSSLSANNPTFGGEVDVKASTITWLGKKVVGEHSGTIALKSGGLKFDNDKLVGGHFIMDMNSIICTDIKGPKADKLVGHLKNEDFFEVDKYSTAEFILTEAIKLEGNNYKLIGNLTIKGITNPIEFDAMISDKSASAILNIDRTSYDIKYGSGSFFDNLGDRAIDNNFQLTINLVLK